MAFADGQNGWAAGNVGTIVHTTDGSTWSTQPSGVTVALNGLFALDAAHAWAVGNAGTILATTNGGASWTPNPAASP
ncbi:MAG: hypothetical protein HZY76_08740 [Anaerolineae bacterium]|nr:MAG: hypothetical protein HZY76_08740 [Anaerolineae bacterium]